MSQRTRVEQVVGEEAAAATKLDEGEDVDEMSERAVTAVSIAAKPTRSTTGTTDPFTTRTNRPFKPSMLMLHTLVPRGYLPRTLGGRGPRTPN